MKNIVRGIVIIFALFLKAFSAFALTATGTLTVQATVVTNCTVSAGTLNFGNVDTVTLAGAASNASGTFTTTCTNGTPYTIALDGGSNFSGGNRMAGPSGSFLPYGLYKNTTATQPWGSGVGQTVSATGTSAPQTNTVYGKINQGNYTLTTGAYTDAVMITVTF